MERRREMKRTGNMNVEYAEICKTIRKRITEDVRKFNCELVKSTIESNKSLRKASC